MLQTLYIDLDVCRQLNIISFVGALNDVKHQIESDYENNMAKAPYFLSHILDQRKPLFSAILMCADRAYPSKERDLYVEWKGRAQDENYNQGDLELREGLEVSPMCDRGITDYDVYELSNISFVVMPVRLKRMQPSIR